MSHPKSGSQPWLDQVDEPIINPARVIVDPHHHFWHHDKNPYLLEHLWGAGLNHAPVCSL